jgi:uncharacterized protein (TIGR02145 family)
MNKKKTSIILTLLVFAVILFSCEKEKAVFFPPELGEMKVSDITDTSLCVKCSVIKNDELPLQEVGFCVYQSKDSSVVRYIKCDNQESFSTTITDLLPQTTYCVKAYAKNVVGTNYGEVIKIGASQLNGHDWVDLALPSGIKWATCNVGAITPDGSGSYFAWGEIVTKETYDWNTYHYCKKNGRLTKYCNNSSYGQNGFADNLTILEASDDAATANLGAGWRMPTYDEFKELINNCMVTWTTQNGVNGCLFTGPNGNSIFMPAVGRRYDNILDNCSSNGYYWSSSLYTNVPRGAWYLGFESGVFGMYHSKGGGNRHYGRPVRAVCK